MKYIVTGSSGKLGKELCPLIACETPSHNSMDISDYNAVRAYCSQSNADAIIHLAAISDRKRADEDKRLAYRINVQGTANVARVAEATGKKMIYVSTEIVFPGTSGNYSEHDTPDPKGWYAATKLAGEFEVRDIQSHLVIRTTFRPSVWGFPTAYSNVYTTGDYVDIIASEIALCLTINPNGILHIGTPIKSWLELAQRRNPNVRPEEYADNTFLRRDLNISKWEKIKMEWSTQANS